MRLSTLVPSILFALALGGPCALAAADAPTGDPALQERLAQIDAQRKQLEQKLAEVRARIAQDAEVAKAQSAAAEAQKAREQKWSDDAQVKIAREAAAKAGAAYEETLQRKIAAHPEAGKAATELAALKAESQKTAQQHAELARRLNRIRAALDWVDPEIADAREALEKAEAAQETLGEPLAKASRDAATALKAGVDEKIRTDAKGGELLAKEKDLQAQLQQVQKDLAGLRKAAVEDPALAALRQAADAADKAASELRTKPEFQASAEAIAKARAAHEELVARKLADNPEAKPLVDELKKLDEQSAAGKDKQRALEAAMKAATGELAKGDAEVVAAAKARNDANEAARALVADADKALKEAQAAARTALDAKLQADADGKQITEQLAALKAEATQLTKKPKKAKAEKIESGGAGAKPEQAAPKAEEPPKAQ